ncbi:MAG: DUF1853 family protein [Gammaproteobacteria bacterium]|nr:DUF1853 family protein [Gammaproteobacteria bacterium]
MSDPKSYPINKYIADILWCINSPTLIIHDHDFFSDQQQAALFSEQVKFQIENNYQKFIIILDKYLSNLKTKRLGDRFELFWLIAFEVHPGFQVVEHNLQLVQNKVTLGELDLIVKDLIHDKYIHIELSCKYYLRVEQESNHVGRWIGPGKKDFLDRKLKKTFNKQLLLPKLDAAKSILNNKNLIVDDSKVIFRGRLFLPSSLTMASRKDILESYRNRKTSEKQWLEGAYQINENCNLGYWGTANCLKEFSRTNELDISEWHWLTKPDWFSDCVANPKKLTKLDVLYPIQLKHNRTEDFFFLVEKDWLDHKLLKR